MILGRSRGLCVGEWTEIVNLQILHHRLLVMDEIGMISHREDRCERAGSREGKGEGEGEGEG